MPLDLCVSFPRMVGSSQIHAHIKIYSGAFKMFPDQSKQNLWMWGSGLGIFKSSLGDYNTQPGEPLYSKVFGNANHHLPLDCKHLTSLSGSNHLVKKSRPKWDNEDQVGEGAVTQTGNCLLISYLGHICTSEISQWADPPLQIHKTHFLSANVNLAGGQNKDCRLNTVNLDILGDGRGGRWLISHH